MKPATRGVWVMFAIISSCAGVPHASVDGAYSRGRATSGVSAQTSSMMVASVLITSIFQSLFPVILASKPFVEWVTPKLPSET